MKHSDIAHFRQLNSLRRRFISRSRRFPPTLEPAAMVDVVLLILLFFMVSPTFVTRSGIRITLPEGNVTSGVPMRASVVTMTGEGLVFLNDQRTDLDSLGEAFKLMVEQDGISPLILELDESITLQTQMRIYQDAVASGITDISIATRRLNRPSVP
jgi:biopolymer transport protein ExbD